jgi:UDP-N-acetyl-D-glucosamine/UDP-N-acetyl-D-galactosamine dehydrogenase
MLETKICVIGLGYVGLPLAVAFSEKFKVIGYDTNHDRVSELKSGVDKTDEVSPDVLKKPGQNLVFVTNKDAIKGCNIYIVTVPTPIDENNLPNLNPLISASQLIGSVLNKNDIVIYESTVYPGVTEDVCVPEIEKYSEMIFNKDFFCGYSPERINPGDKTHTIRNILKVTSGSTLEIAKKIDDLYKEIIDAGTYLAPSIRVAEASKIIENIQRDVNIALINELAIIFDRMDIDTHEVLRAAETKWNFIKLSPGLVGGHCIGVDPYYLSFKAANIGYEPDLILASRKINNGMSKYIAEKTVSKMLEAGFKIKKSEILVLGITFKENCPDMRNTKVLDIVDELSGSGANVELYDPWVENDNLPKNKYKFVEDPLGLNKTYDAIVVAVSHECFKKYSSLDYMKLSNPNAVIIDIKNIVENPTWKL